MLKRIFASMIVFVTLCTMFTACGSKNEAPTEQTTAEVSTVSTTAVAPEEENKYGDTGGLKLPLVDKPLTLTACADTTNPNVGDSWLIKELENRTGIKLELTIIAPTQWEEKTKIMLSSGNLTDFAPVPKEQINVLGMKGVIVPVNKYDGMLPNFKKIFYEKYPWVMKSFTAEDGNLYFYPTFENTRDVNHGLLYRKDIFDKEGIKP